MAPTEETAKSTPESTLGKRKHREVVEETNDSRSSTLFVSNLPYTATSTDLKTLFSDIAPVRNAFIVLEHGTGVSKGVGYVSFAIKEDVQLALDKISSEGLTIDGRGIRAQLAETRHKDKDSASASGNVDQAAKPARVGKSKNPKGAVTTPKDPLAIRTIVLSGLPSSIDAKVLWKKVRKQEGAEKVDWPAKLQTGDEDSTQAYVLFSDPKTAQDAIKKLHAHIFKGSIISATLKKRVDNLQKPIAFTSTRVSASSPSTKSQPDHRAAPSRANRLIVRNLPFDIKEEDINATFLPYGPIHSIDIPKTEDGRAKGFAFVWMMSKGDAQRALEKCNGTKIRAGVAEQLVQAKQKKKKQVRVEERISKEKTRKEQEQAEEEVAGVERVIAVDWALSKDRWEEEKAKMDEDVEMGEDEGVSDSGEGSENGDDSDSESGSDEKEDSDPGENSSDSSGDEDEVDLGEEPQKPQLPPPEAGTTLFVRNIPFEATEDELRVLFRTFGPLRYARITMDYETGRSRGTGFVCFWNVEDADKAVEKSDLLRLETTGSTSTVKPNPFKLPSILTPDPSSSLAQSLVLQGRTLDVVRAVTRNEATKLKEEGERKREKADKRNAYLLREGVITVNSPAAGSLSAEELEKRTNSFNARRNLLKTNPSLYVSRTRLSVRQIPVGVTEYMLKRLANYAIREFEEEVRRGEREPLDAGELEEEEVAGKGKDKKKSGQKVKQAKIVRESGKVDALTGKGKSKGYGFLELHKHDDALRVLRWANNNKEVWNLWDGWWKSEVEEAIKKEKGSGEDGATRLKKLKEEVEKGESRWKVTKKTLIVEFSIENVQVTERRKSRQTTTPGTPKPKGRAEAEREDPSEARRPKKRQRTSAQDASLGKGSPKSGKLPGALVAQKGKQRRAKGG